MEYRNLDDVRNQLLAAGLVLESVSKANGGVDVGGVYVESVRSVRCDVSGEKKKKTGSYWLHELRLADGIWITGAYWLDHGNSKGVIELRKTCAKCGGDMPLKAAVCPSAGCGSKKTKAREIPPEQIEAHKKRLAEARRLAEAEAARDAEKAAAWANAVWVRCREIFSPDEHEYLTRKKLKSAHGCRVFESNDGVVLDGAEKEDYEYLAQFHGALVVPMCDTAGRRRGLQFILSRTQHKALIAKQERDKNFWPRDMLNPGLHCVIGGAMRGVGLVAEGFATAASLAEESNVPVAVAFTANRLAPVADALWKAAKKRLNLLIAADDDWLQRCVACKKVTPVAEVSCCHCNNPHGKENAGVRYAQEAARGVSGAWFVPAFSVARPTDKKGPTDFNDLRCIEGPDAVRAQVEAKLADLGWQTPARPVRPTPGSGGSPPRGSGGDAESSSGEERRKAVSIMGIDDLVERFIPIDDGTGKVLFDTWTSKLAMSSQMMALASAGVGVPEIKRHPVWIDRGSYYVDQIGFDPAGDDQTVKLNTWRGWPMQPKSGACDKLLDLLWHLCSREGDRPDLVDWVLRWMAYPLQHPGAKMQSALIVHGEQGTGKSTVFKVLAEIYGYKDNYQNYAVILDQKALESKYNSDWDSKLYVLAEEVVNSSDKWQLKNELKEMVTGDRIRIEKKFLDAYYQANRCNIVFLSNEDQPLPLDNKDRRHCVIYTPPALELNQYADIREEIENGGVAAFYDYLMSIDLVGFKPWAKPPMTEAKQALIDASRSSEDEFFQDWFAGETPFPVCACRGDDLFAAYVLYCQRIRERNVAPRRRFRLKLSHMNDWKHRAQVCVYDSYRFDGETKQTRLEIPGDRLITAHAQKEDYTKQPGETAQQWATRSMLDFAKAVEDLQPQLKAA